MKVLFLDFDGVLNNHKSTVLDDGEIFSKAACKNLRHLMREEPDLLIVVSSSWRHGGLPYVRHVLEKNGINKDKVIGITGIEPGNRGHQIKCFLDKHPEITSFIIFDDENDMEPLIDKLIKTSSYIGLTSEHVEKAIKLLQSQSK
jgi:hypothetical protein